MSERPTAKFLQVLPPLQVKTGGFLRVWAISVYTGPTGAVGIINRI